MSSNQYYALHHFEFFAEMDRAYSAGDARLLPYFDQAPDLEGLEAAMQRRAAQFQPAQRQTLAEFIREQYADLDEGYGQALAQRLLNPNSFTICTAHQPCFLGGSLYFLSKIVDAIALARQVQAAQPQADIIPVYWMGAEDHDFEEISQIQLFGKRLAWPTEANAGPVGEYILGDLSETWQALAEILGDSPQAAELLALWQSHYQAGRSFAQATAAWLHACFAAYGLLILRPQGAAMKQAVLPIFRQELLAQSSEGIVQQTLAEWEVLGLKAQAKPREINLFYLSPMGRKRLVREAEGRYHVLDTDLRWTEAEILAELAANPQRFSPNVILRPLMQEAFMPNLAYVGGGGELAYWLQLKGLFEYQQIPYPILFRRTSFLWLDKGSEAKIQSWGLSLLDFLQAQPSAQKQELVRRFSELDLSLEGERQAFQQLFEGLSQRLSAQEPTLEQQVLAQAAQLSKQLDKWEERLLREAKRRQETLLQQYDKVRERLLPGGGLQERQHNFMMYALRQGLPALIEQLLQAAKPGQGLLAILEV